MKKVHLAATVLVVAFATANLNAQAISLNNTARGDYSATKANVAKGGGTANGNFVAEADLGLRSYIVFDLSSASGIVTSAVLNFDFTGAIANPVVGSPTVIFYDFGGSIIDLIAGTASPASTYADLGSGQSFGNFAAANGTGPYTFSLNSNALAALTAGAGGRFAFGATVNQGSFAGFSYPLPLVRLDLVTEAPAIPEPASWAMMVGGFGVVGFAMRARRKAAVSLA